MIFRLMPSNQIPTCLVQEMDTMCQISFFEGMRSIFRAGFQKD